MTPGSLLRTVLAAAFALAMLPSAGCASLVVTPLTLKPYSGVRTDAAIIAPGKCSAACYSLSRALMPFAIIDLPLSFVVDTALLPVTIPATLCASGEPDEDEDETGDAQRE